MEFKRYLSGVILALVSVCSHAQQAAPVNNWATVSKSYEDSVQQIVLTPEEKNEVLALVNPKAPENEKFTFSQYFVVVDRNPEKQNAFLAFYDAETKKIEISNPTKVSTGSKAKKHFITPLGWFEHTTDNGSYRALGTKNENGIRGIGKKGMIVFDFGWNKANAGWKENFIIDIRFQMHATDPDRLEQRLGKPDSQGCVRIHSSFNEFLDKFGILDKHYEESADPKWVLRKDRTPVPNAGSFLLVIDSAKNPKGM
jgi:Legume-like lectin family